MTISKLYLPLLLPLLLFACEPAKNETAQREDLILEDHRLYFQKSAKMEEKLKGKPILSLNELSLASQPIQDSNPVLILYYTTYDCSSCVVKGFDFLKKQENAKSLQVLTIEGGEKANYIIQQYEYEGDIWRDSTNAIQDELGYFPTPVLINYSHDKGIKNIYFIPTFEDSVMLGKFKNLLTSN